MLEVGGVVIGEKDYSSFSEDDIVAFNAFVNVMHDEAYPEDPSVPLDITRADVLNIPDFVALREFWGRDPDGTIAAMGNAAWMKTEENRHLATIRIEVRPDRRRRGIAKAILRCALDAVETDGRTLVTTYTIDRIPAGEQFARSVGADPGSATHTNRLVLGGVDRELLRSWIDDAPLRAAGYSLVSIDGPYPDDFVEEIAGVYGVMNTAPRDDLDVEDQVHTVDQLRQREKAGVAAGTTRWSLFPRCDATGELVGLTVVYWNPAEPKTVYQGDTGVHPDHRGHAIGKWLKAAMIERILVELPGAVEIRTGNADSNDAMLGINRALGFEPYIAQMNWQVPVERVQSYLAGSSS